MILYHQRGRVLMAQVIDKQVAYDLIDQIPLERLPSAIKLLKSMVPLPIDDEPVTEGDRRAILRSEAWFREHGDRGIPMSDVLADFGLTPDDFPLKDK
jgi:hypothetical protein